MSAMKRTENAHRVIKARRIVQAAYRRYQRDLRPKVLRYYLIGGDIAVAIVQGANAPEVSVRVARLLPNGTARRLLSENRDALCGYPDLYHYVEALHAKHGGAVEERRSS